MSINPAAPAASVTLRVWFAQTGIRASAVAKSAGISSTMLSHCGNGLTPGAPTRKRIVAAMSKLSKARVTDADFCAMLAAGAEQAR